MSQRLGGSQRALTPCSSHLSADAVQEAAHNFKNKCPGTKTACIASPQKQNTTTQRDNRLQAHTILLHFLEYIKD